MFTVWWNSWTINEIIFCIPEPTYSMEADKEAISLKFLIEPKQD